MTPEETIAWIGSIGSIATPILLALFGFISVVIQTRIEKSRTIERELRERATKLEEALREDRLKIYIDILEPFIMVLTKSEGLVKGKSNQQLGQEKIKSIDYRRTAFKLSLFAGDNVLRAYNDLMQFFYSLPTDTTDNKKETGLQLFDLFGKLILEIRKSIGNETTKLGNIDMIEWLITDIREIKKTYQLEDQKLD